MIGFRHAEQVETDSARFGTFGSNAVPYCLLGILGHEVFKLSLCPLVFRMGVAGARQR